MLFRSARRKLARTSAAPGKTRLANIYRLTVEGGPGGPGRWSVYFVDLPGYGYARVPRTVRETWGEMATDYLAKREQLVLSIHILDSRHDPTQLDVQLREWLTAHAKFHLTVATKADKLSANELQRNLRRARQTLGDGGEIVAYSAVTGAGRPRVWRAISEALDRLTIPLAKT